MAAIPKYVFVIEDKDGNIYEFEKATQAAWERYENAPGRCRFFVPWNDLKLSASSLPDNKFAEIRIYRDTLLVWQGFITYIQDTKDGTLVYGETYLSILGWYSVRYNQEYSDSDIASIITAEYDNIAARSNCGWAGRISKGDIEAPYINGTTDNLTITRTLYNDNFLNILREFVAVARGQMISGEIISWNQYAVFDITLSEDNPTFSFKRDVSARKTAVKFELGSEIIDYTLPKDMRSVFNQVKGFSVQEGPKVLNKEVSDATSQSNFYRRESYPYFGQVTNQNELDEKTTNFLRELKDPRRDMMLKFSAGMTPFNGYSMGDHVKIVINRGRTSISEYRRVIGMFVEIQKSGVELTTPILEKPRS